MAMSNKISLNIQQQKTTCFTSQKLYLSRENIKSLGLKISKYCMISYLNSEYICKIYNKDISNTICMINTTVENLNPCYREMSHKLIQPISHIYAINSIEIDLIFNSIENTLKWQQQNKSIKDLLKRYILKMYSFSSHCKINLSHTKISQKLGLEEVIIHSATFNKKSDIDTCIIIGNVTNNTKISILNMFSRNEYNHLINPDKINFHGLENSYEQLIELININNYLITTGQINIKTPKQILLIGPCGIGKKSLIYAVATKLKIPIVLLNGGNLFTKELGETEKYMRNIFKNTEQIANYSSACILLIEDLENICPKLTVNSGIHVARITSQFLKLLDGINSNPRLIVIATTSNSTLLHPGLRRSGRIDYEMHLKLPTETIRFQILKFWTEILFDKIGFNEGDITELCKSISRITPGYTGSDLKLICEKVLLYINRQNMNSSMKYSELKKLFHFIVHNSYPTSVDTCFAKSLRQNNSNLKNIGGYDKIISMLYRTIEWPIKHPELFKYMGISQPKGLLMYGPPGCAKTSLACAIAKEMNFCFFSISAAQLYSPYVGVAEATLMSVFHQARQNSPSIVFIDEIDAIFGSRSSDNHNDVQNRLLSTLLIEMDGIVKGMNTGGTGYHTGIFIIAATNRPIALDSALMRPGRFDKIVYVPPPDEKSRLEILQKITQNSPLHSDVDLKKLAHNTHQYSGADLTKLCKEGILDAMTCEGLSIKEIKFEYFERALLKNKPSLTQQQLSLYESFKI